MGPKSYARLFGAKQNLTLAEFFEQFASDAVFSAVTGLTPAVFKYIYDRYCGPAAPEGLRTPVQLFHVFNFMKVYPTQRALGQVTGNYGQAPSWIHWRINQAITALAERINELNINEHDSLPAPWFTGAGGSVDGFAVYCRSPMKQDVAKAFWSGKYNSPCVKFDIITSHSGVPLTFSGPYIGVTHDIKMWHSRPNPMPPGVRLLGDAGYVGAAGVIHALKKPRGGELTDEQHLFNRGVQWWRATVEHVIGFVKRFRIVGGRYRGPVVGDAAAKRLHDIVKICIHVSAVHIRQHAKRDFAKSIPKLEEYLQTLEAKGSYKSRYDIARDRARWKRMTAAEREEKEADDDWEPPETDDDEELLDDEEEQSVRPRRYEVAAAGLPDVLGTTTDSEGEEEDDTDVRGVRRRKAKRRPKRVRRAAVREFMVADDGAPATVEEEELQAVAALERSVHDR